MTIIWRYVGRASENVLEMCVEQQVGLGWGCVGGQQVELFWS